MTKLNSAGFKFSRRQFITIAAATTGTACAAGFLWPPGSLFADEFHGTGQAAENYGPEQVIYSMCHNCQTFCTMKAVVTPMPEGSPVNSLVRKLSGNPYSPFNAMPQPPLPYDTPIVEAAAGAGNMAQTGSGHRGGRICLKGQAGLQVCYDAMRIRTPLKRVGPRGSGQWQSISWEEAIGQIVHGAPDIGVPGLKDIWAYVPEKPVMTDWARVKNKEMSQQDFHQKYKDVLIDTNHPDLGPKANQILTVAAERRIFIQERYWSQTVGSINAFDHGGICGASGVTGIARSFATPKPRPRLYADVDHAEFVIVWGTDPLISNKGPTVLAPRYMNALARGVKFACIDPHYSRMAQKSQLWVAPQPGTDGALALGMGRWIVENKRYDEQYLTNPNAHAAKADGEPTWSDATYLINVSNPRKPKLTAKDLGIGSEKEWVVMENGVPVPHSRAGHGQLEVDTTLPGGMRVKSAFTLYKERVMERTLEQYAAICQITPEEIISLAREFTSHGKKASITAYRGPGMHGNGYYNLRAITLLNHLIGNYDWKGGSMSAAPTYTVGQGRYALSSVPKGFKPWGLTYFRNRLPYEKSSLFARDGYPAKRPWFTFGNSQIQELLGSAADRYPYPLKAVFFHRHNHLMSVPAAHKLTDILKNPEHIPLFVASDIIVSETSACADFILPDLSYLERWGYEGMYPHYDQKVAHFGQPVTRILEGAQAYEDTLIAIAKKMNWPGVGKNAFSDGSSLDRSQDFYLKMAANIAFDGEPVPPANDEELSIFESSRRKALGKHFDLAAWQNAVKPDEWRRVVYVLNRGGRYESIGQGHQGAYLKYKLPGFAVFYDDGVAGLKHSYSGKLHDGLPKVETLKTFDGKELPDDLPLLMTHWKARHLGTQRLISSAWLREIEPENYLIMHPSDASARGLQTGDPVIIKTLNNQVTATVKVSEEIKPGVVGSTPSYGHHSYGSQSYTIDGKPSPVAKGYGHYAGVAGKQDSGYAPGRNTGFKINDAMEIDDFLQNACLSDPIGSGANQLRTRVQVIKKV